MLTTAWGFRLAGIPAPTGVPASFRVARGQGWDGRAFGAITTAIFSRLLNFSKIFMIYSFLLRML